MKRAPTEEYVIVKKDDPSKQTASGIVLPDVDKKDTETKQRRAVWGTIVAAPAPSHRPYGQWDEPGPWERVGVRVLFSQKKAHEFEGSEGRPLYAVYRSHVLAFEAEE